MSKSLFAQLCENHDRSQAGPQWAADHLETTTNNFRSTFYGSGESSELAPVTDDELDEINEIELIEAEMTTTRLAEISRHIDAGTYAAHLAEFARNNPPQRFHPVLDWRNPVGN